MRYAEAVDFLAGLVDHERLPSLARDLSLEPVRGLLNALGNPQDKVPIIHVTGTKGKGSVSTMIELILRKAGYRTGLYTSPDLTGFEERFRVDGQPISPDELGGVVARIQAAMEAASIGQEPHSQPSRFDVATALAFLHFATRQVDVAVVEVGMGGRTDSTNVCLPQVSVITSVSYDHTRQLGNTLTAIATEKAGIIKPGRPVISGVAAGEARSVVEAACRERGCPLRQLGVDFSYRYLPGDVSGSAPSPGRIWITSRDRAWPEMPLALLGEHQAANAAVAVAVIEQLRDMGWLISDEHVRDGLSQVRCPARIEVARRHPLVIVDCAHNVASAQALISTLLGVFPACFGPQRSPVRRRSLIFGSSWDKDLAGVLGVLCPHFEHVYLTPYARSTRCASTEDLQAAVRASGVNIGVTSVADAGEAWTRAEAASSPDDVICITGSVFLAGELRGLVSEREPMPAPT